MKVFLKNFGVFILIFLILAALFSLNSSTKTKIENIGSQKLASQIAEGKVGVEMLKKVPI